MAKELSESVTDLPGINGLRMAEISSVLGAGGVMIKINGAVVGPCATLGSYTATVGDQVAVFRQDSTWLVLGKSRCC